MVFGFARIVARERIAAIILKFCLLMTIQSVSATALNILEPDVVTNAFFEHSGINTTATPYETVKMTSQSKTWQDVDNLR